MPGLKIILEGDGSLPELRDRLVGGSLTHVVALAGGMASGKPSVAVVVQTAEGQAILGETSLALFLTAADALRARHGDPRKDNEPKAKA